MGFGWKDQTVYKFGVQYGVNNRLQLRAGYNYGASPIPDNMVTFNLLAPATVERHYSLGFTYKANENLEVTGAYMYAASNSQSACGQNIVNCASFNMHQNMFGMTLGWVLDPGPGALDEYGDSDWSGINFDGWYAGLGIGQSQYRDVASYIDSTVQPTGSTPTSANTRSEGWKVYTGYQFNTYLGIEGGYTNLNDMTAHTGSLRTNVKSDAWTLAAVGTYPLTAKVSVNAKLGAAYILSLTKAKDGAALTRRIGDDGYDPYYGVGISYAIFDNLSLRADWDRFDRKHLNIDLITAGLAVKF
jgi:long-chain fatty acid transport protein